MNMHMLSHLAKCVSDWGPLWAYSCFSFESSNHNLKKLFHGSKDMSKQVIATYLQNVTFLLPFLLDGIYLCCEPNCDRCNKTTRPKFRTSETCCLD